MHANFTARSELGQVLLAYRARAAHLGGSDFISAGPSGKPCWPDGLPTDHLKPAAAEAGIGTIGWHTFRHTYSTLLHALGTTPAVQKELVPYADIQTTLNICTQAISAEKREAASKVVNMLWRM